MIKIYTDGACSGNPGKGGWGVVILNNNKEILLKSLLNLITIPSYKLSVIKVLDPAPKMKIFSYFFWV